MIIFHHFPYEIAIDLGLSSRFPMFFPVETHLHQRKSPLWGASSIVKMDKSQIQRKSPHCVRHRHRLRHLLRHLLILSQLERLQALNWARRILWQPLGYDHVYPEKWWFHGSYPLVNVYITMENHHFSWVNPRTKSPFSSSQTVSLPGRVLPWKIWWFPWDSISWIQGKHMAELEDYPLKWPIF